MKLILDSGIFGLGIGGDKNGGVLEFYNLIFSETSIPLEECARVFFPAKMLCFDALVASHFVIPPAFIMMSHYDIWGINQIMGLKCAPYTNPANLQDCGFIERIRIWLYRQELELRMNQFRLYKKNSIWAISCSFHSFLKFQDATINDDYRVPARTGITIVEGLERFLKGKRTIAIDRAKYPNNRACNGIPSGGWNLQYE